jgi:hypothetical protein
MVWFWDTHLVDRVLKMLGNVYFMYHNNEETNSEVIQLRTHPFFCLIPFGALDTTMELAKVL